ncbi:MAG: sulfite exporter TauE/SafE family protein, partial [Maribacter sp.]|nr:sulfite exporter TauE/SafE family protein [Maribacter sp.]
GEVSYNYPLIVIEGLLVGSITGLIGAGGGFLIIPALVILANVEMKVAVGTSLIIIAIKSLMGFFLGDAMTMTIDWKFLAIFTSLSFVGIFIGSYLSNFIDSKKLKKGFGYFILVMAAFIFYMEFF